MLSQNVVCFIQSAHNYLFADIPSRCSMLPPRETPRPRETKTTAFASSTCLHPLSEAHPLSERGLEFHLAMPARSAATESNLAALDSPNKLAGKRSVICSQNLSFVFCDDTLPETIYFHSRNLAVTEHWSFKHRAALEQIRVSVKHNISIFVSFWRSCQFGALHEAFNSMYIATISSGLKNLGTNIAQFF